MIAEETRKCCPEALTQVGAALLEKRDLGTASRDGSKRVGPERVFLIRGVRGFASAAPVRPPSRKKQVRGGRLAAYLIESVTYERGVEFSRSSGAQEGYEAGLDFSGFRCARKNGHGRPARLVLHCRPGPHDVVWDQLPLQGQGNACPLARAKCHAITRVSGRTSGRAQMNICSSCVTSLLEECLRPTRKSRAARTPLISAETSWMGVMIVRSTSPAVF
jgi:hypothetical protein